MVSCHFTPFYKPFRELEEENFKRLIPHFHSQEKKFLMVYLAPLGINLDMLTLHNSYNHSTITSSIRLSFDDLFGRFDTPKRMSKSYKVYLVTVICSLQIQHDGMEEDQKICLIPNALGVLCSPGSLKEVINYQRSSAVVMNHDCSPYS